MNDGYELGIDATLNHNSATHTSPTWVANPDVGDLKLSPKWDTEEAKTRATRAKRYAATLKEIAFTGSVLVNKDNAGFTALADAHSSGSPVDLLILDGAHDTEGAEGYRGDWLVTSFEDDLGPEKLRSKSFELKPALSANVPKKAVVGADSITYTDIGA